MKIFFACKFILFLGWDFFSNITIREIPSGKSLEAKEIQIFENLVLLPRSDRASFQPVNICLTFSCFDQYTNHRAERTLIVFMIILVLEMTFNKGSNAIDYIFHVCACITFEPMLRF